MPQNENDYGGWKYNYFIHIAIKISEMIDIIELKVTACFNKCSSTENCLEIRYTTKAVGADVAMIKDKNQ